MCPPRTRLCGRYNKFAKCWKILLELCGIRKARLAVFSISSLFLVTVTGRAAAPVNSLLGTVRTLTYHWHFGARNRHYLRKIHRSLYAKSSILLHMSSQNVKWAVTFGHHLTKNIYSLFRCGARFCAWVTWYVISLLIVRPTSSAKLPWHFR